MLYYPCGLQRNQVMLEKSSYKGAPIFQQINHTHAHYLMGSRFQGTYNFTYWWVLTDACRAPLWRPTYGEGGLSVFLTFQHQNYVCRLRTQQIPIFGRVKNKKYIKATVGSSPDDGIRANPSGPPTNSRCNHPPWTHQYPVSECCNSDVQTLKLRW